MRERCESCSGSSHCGGSGTYELFDQDGLNRYVCQCHCGFERRRREAAAYDLSPLIRRYGRELLLAVLNS